MALIDEGFSLSVVLSDQGGNQGTLRYDLTAATHALAATDRTAILAALAAVSDTAIVSHKLSENFKEDSTAFGTKELENVALVVARLAGSSVLKTVNVHIPGPKDALFVASSGPDFNVIDPSVAVLTTYLALWEAASEATISDGEVIRDPTVAGNITGKRIHRKSRKG